MIYLHSKSHLHSYSGSLFIANKYKSTAFLKAAHFSKINFHVSLQHDTLHVTSFTFKVHTSTSFYY
jgi:hypothetical protein